MQLKCVMVLFIAVAFVLFRVLIQEKDSAFLLNLTNETSRPAANSVRWALAKFHGSISLYRSCLSKILDQSALANSLPNLIDGCLGKAIWRIWNVRMLTNMDETKLVILPSFLSRGECVQVTLGVGNDIISEQELLQLMPECKLFGADPIYESGNAFMEVGEYFQLAVSGETGVELGQVLMEDGQYHSRNITTIAFSKFLNDYVNVTKIDHLWIDNEGPEYKIFRKYFITNTLNITICQINVEMHRPFEKYNVSQDIFDRLIKDVVAQSSFLPVNTVLEGAHVRSFYVNVVDNYCIEKFLLRNHFDF